MIKLSQHCEIVACSCENYELRGRIISIQDELAKLQQ